MRVREYTEGPYVICKGQYGINHGISWGIWLNGTLVYDARTLKSARRMAKAMAAESGESEEHK